MQRLVTEKRERGAVAVVVGLLAIALMTAGAVSVDVANLWSDKRQLQNGADAGALAIAQACASGEPCPAGPGADPTAQGMAVANKNDGDAAGVVTEISTAAGKVTVQTTGTTEHWFAPVIGVDQTGVDASATAVWVAATGGTSSLPLTFSVCEIAELATLAGTDFVFNSATGQYELVAESTVESVIYLAHPGSASAKESNCAPLSSGVTVPGGFSWIVPDSGVCGSTTTIGQVVGSDPGNPGPAACTEAYLYSQLGKTVMLPVFGASAGSGAGATYTVHGYVGFTLTGFLLQTSASGGPIKYNHSGCSAGNGQCIKGTFSFITDSTGGPAVPAPDWGASTVRLTK